MKTYRINYTLILCLLLIGGFPLFGQKIVKKINKSVSVVHLTKDMQYIASDQLKGRKTGEPGNQAAAQYIAEQFKQTGVQQVPGMQNYYQNIPFQKFIPPTSGSLTLAGNQYNVGTDLLILDGGKIQNKAVAVYADFGWIDAGQQIDDYKDLDVKGKYVIVQGGLPHGGTPVEVFDAMPKKRAFAKSRGALGIIEIYNLSYPWNFFRNYFAKERLEVMDKVTENASLFHAWIQLPSGLNKPNFVKGRLFEMDLQTSGAVTSEVDAVNVIGWIPGKNKKLADQYILLSAHFDHVGLNAGQPVQGDTIWNGARDNAWGTVGILAAARFFTKYPPERSVLLAGLNGEEMGLLGSKYLASHPVLPWNKVIFNLNSDGAGYSDTTIVSVFGLNRVGAADEINQSCLTFGLTAFGDPAPEQGLFDRSDNVSFAQLGIPAPTFASGFKAFDAAVFKYYHQSIDNPDNISYGYLHRFTKAFILSAYQIANKKELPRWSVGDKYEAAGKKLYGY